MLAGFFFALLWPSASTATKIALESPQLLAVAQVRFAVAGLLMLFFTDLLFKQKLPSVIERKQITVFDFFNITLYLGCYVIVMQHVTAGIGTLEVATNPLFISFFSLFFLKKKLKSEIFVALLLGTLGVVIASWPLLENASVTVRGLILLLFSMLPYSAGAIYFSSKK